ncbi:MAG: polysaccharide pyruvyl transferase CsaB [Armatimonadetes bacterium]|nr:polysaccharide pyruvyl transferase CsaB [Armatimonadota bacterium]NIM23251.1 polysaccharide pyruvyl transferase CsaB [Armatimonadota bacterium]NIM67119.1 polysaccharide pyruvyl transferase CsaB [Armatimonadota bacterium]NIM75646.1 polysaccharide pyruvyl transferase CsaB [Armatimonadota bacterium]NIN05308.1 polysaccharide pyruvyl transferase CsaB [Armatimonadota bacterium]
MSVVRILLSGYYGCGNIGDEAILAALAGTFRRLAPEIEPVALSADPADTTAQHSIDAVPRFSFGAIRGEMSKSRIFISGGGGLLQDSTSWRSPLYYLALLRLAKRRGLCTAALCQGIGPLRRGWLRRLTVKVFRDLDLIVVRDEASAQMLVEMGLAASSIHTAADAAWLLDPSPLEAAASLLQREGIDLESPAVGLFLRPLPKMEPILCGDLWEAVAAGLRGFLEEHKGSTVFVPMQKPGDAQAAKEVMKQFAGKTVQVTGDYSPADLLRLSGDFDLVVGMRLHGLIFAARMGTPAVGISYDPKVDALITQARLPAAMSAHVPDAEAFSRALEESWQRRDDVRNNLSAFREESRRKALQAVEMTLKLLE